MALVIEDGSNVSGAESYVSAAEYAAFHLAYYGTAETATEAVQEAALRRAAAYLDGLSWGGLKAHGRLQAMAWPRSWVADAEGFAIDAASVPKEVKDAQMIFARLEIAEPGALAPNYTASKQKTLVEVKGIRWQAPAIAATSAASRTLVLDALSRLRGFISPVGMASVVRS